MAQGGHPDGLTFTLLSPLWPRSEFISSYTLYFSRTLCLPISTRTSHTPLGSLAATLLASFCVFMQIRNIASKQ